MSSSASESCTDYSDSASPLESDSEYSEGSQGSELEKAMQSALTAVENVLMEAKQGRPAAVQNAMDAQHTYGDKFHLVEVAVDASTDTLLHLLARLSMTAQQWQTAAEWNFELKESVYAVATLERKCGFVEKTEEIVEPDSYSQTDISRGNPGSTRTTTIKHKTMKRVVKYHWRFSYTLRVALAHQSILGESAEKGQVLVEIQRHTMLITSSEKSPHPEIQVVPRMTLCISDLLADDSSDGWLHVTANGPESRFTIDRKRSSCATPRRNAEVNHAVSFFAAAKTFSFQLARAIGELMEVKEDKASDMDLDDLTRFPLPAFMFLQRVANAGPSETLTAEHQQLLLENFKRKVSDFMGESVAKIFPPEEESADFKSAPGRNSLLSFELMHLMIVLMLVAGNSTRAQQCVNYAEHMLRKQVIAAIGKSVGDKDFREFMEFHHRKLFHTHFQPRSFSYAVRRPDCQPEGEISIENGSKNLIQTLTREVGSVRANPEMCFKIGASTKVRFAGRQFLHGWLSYTFGKRGDLDFRLTARARQFSSYILVLGKLLDANEIDPEYAIVVKNKDEFFIPLLKKTLPSAKEFKDAISSLSPEQQRFCNAFRAMQLAGSVLTLCVLQIKPQIECLLKLPPNSLVKEIRLMERVMSLFAKYQVSSDLFTYEGDAKAATADKVEAVRANVAAVVNEIEEEEKKQLEEQKAKRRMEEAQLMQEQMLYMEDDADDSSECEEENFDEGDFMMRMDMRAISVNDEKQDVLSVQLNEGGPSGKNAKAVVAKPKAAEKPAPEGDSSSSSSPASDGGALAAMDFTKLPAQLDKIFETTDSGLRTAKVRVGDAWQRSSQASLLSKPQSSTLDSDGQRDARNAAFDLLDALSRGGELPFLHTDTHVILPAAHSFPDSLMDTVVRRNVNPIERVERSVLMMASVVLGQNVATMTRKTNHPRLKRTLSNKSLRSSSSS